VTSDDLISSRLGLNYWPFDVVPDMYSDVAWIAREELDNQVKRLLRKLELQPATSLHLLWANFGSGKTHTLLSIRDRLIKGEYGQQIPLYSALPKGARNFLDVYKTIVRSISTETIRSAAESARSSVGASEFENEISQIWPELWHCFERIRIGNPEQIRIASAWLRAEQGVRAKELSQVDISGRIRTVDDAIAALTALVRLFRLAGNHRVVILVDEFQRIETLRGPAQDEINSGVHSFFNSAGRGLSLILSFSFGVEQNIQHFLNAELTSRSDPIGLRMPAMTYQEGVEFVTELIGAASDKNPNDVFDGEVIQSVVNLLEQIANSRGESVTITPRRLMKLMNHLALEALVDFDNEKSVKMTTKYVKTVLSEEVVTEIVADRGDEED
jgi:Cdc6-like AAA superfamily ATPase